MPNPLEELRHHQPAYGELLVLVVGFGAVEMGHHCGRGDELVDEVGELGEDFGTGGDGH